MECAIKSAPSYAIPIYCAQELFTQHFIHKHLFKGALKLARSQTFADGFNKTG